MSVSSTSNERLRTVRTRLGELSVRSIDSSGDGPITVFWSSMFVDAHTWDRMLPLLRSARPERSFVLIDPPGIGLSEPLRRLSSIREAAGAAQDTLEQLGIDTPVDWVGNAFGGHVGYELAVKSGALRSFAAISSPVDAIPPALRVKIRALAPVLRAFGPVKPVRSAVIGALLTDASAADPRIRDVVIQGLQRSDRASMMLALRSFILNRVDVSALLPRITVPSLFVASDDRGDWSPTETERAVAAVGPLARAITISAARTLIPLEQPETLATELLSFWDVIPAR